MKAKIANLVNDSIKELNVFVDDAFISTEEGKKIFNIVKVQPSPPKNLPISSSYQQNKKGWVFL